MSDTSTPRTDAACDYTSPEKLHRVALQLERELTAARAELAALKADREWLRSTLDDAEQTYYAMQTELAALRAEQAKPQWLPIESAPRDGTVIQLGNEHGAWFGHWEPVYQSGFKPKNPWFSLMLNHEHMGRVITIPTHWMPLPASPPRDLREGGE